MALGIRVRHAATMMNDTQTPLPPLERRQQRRILGGVAAGLGRRFAVSSWWFRIGFFVLAFAGGLGILLYLIGWALIPEEGSADSWLVLRVRQIEGWESVMGAVLIVVAVALVLGTLDFVSTGLVWAAALIVLGVLLYRGDLRRSPPGSSSPTGPDPGGTAYPPLPDPTADDLSSAVPVAPASTPRPASVLGRVVVGVVLVTVGAMAALDLAGVISLGFDDYLAVTVTGLGLGLVVGAWWGRARWLILPAVLLLPVLVLAAAVGFPNTTRVGEAFYGPSFTGEVRPSYRLAAGTLTVDLQSIELNEGDELSFTAELGAGRLVVVGPPGAEILVNGDVGLGRIDVVDSAWEGVNIERSVLVPGYRGRITVTARVGIGEIEVDRWN